MAIERLLGEEIGPLAGKLHTGRSRNDQVATDVAMVVQAHSLRAIELAGAAMERLLELAERHRDWPMPGYTHLQRAQPVYLGHHLLAYFWMLARDVLRFQFALDSASVMPLGSGALAGVNWEIDRRAVADDLGFEHVSHNSIDGASNRDFVLDYLAAASTCAMHLSRLGSEIVIWSSTEFGFCELDESFSSGSSIMPQKKNPDSAELLRAKSPRVAADYLALLGTMHALPLTYGKDMQEDKEPLFDAIDTVELCLDATEGMLAGIAFDRERLEAASGRRDAGRDRDRRPAGPQGGAVPRGARDRRRPGPRRGRARQVALRADPRGAARSAPSTSTTPSTRCCGARAGWSRSGSRAAPAPRRSSEQIDAGARDPGRGRGAGRAKSGREHGAARRRRAARRRLLRPLRPRRSPATWSAAGSSTKVAAARSSRPRATSATIPPATPTSGSPPRTEVLFGPPGRAYVYLSYGIHSLLNAVAEPEGEAAAVLIRALEPTAGLEEMRERRGERRDVDLCSGPGKLTEALGVGLDANGADLSARPRSCCCHREPSWRGEIVTGPRIGITKAVERPWRFCLAGSRFVSRPRPGRG